MSLSTTWSDVDHYYGDLLVQPDPLFDHILVESERAGLPAINITAHQGKMLAILVRLLNARRVLEVGTLGGYSSAWMASSLPEGGELITLELNPDWAEIANQNLAPFDFSEQIRIELGYATESMQAMIDNRVPPFDLIFIDADKTQYADYLAKAVELSRPGTTIIADNVVRNGEVTREDSTDALVQGIRRFNEAVADDPRLDATVIQTVGSKGYDGFCILAVM